jgi:NAD+ synthase
MDYTKVANHIIDWLNEKVEGAKLNGFVVGVSGGVDSALVSILCALTRKRTVCLNMPIHQAKDQFDRANLHIKHLQVVHENVEGITIDLTRLNDVAVDTFSKLDLGPNQTEGVSDLALANTRSRLRMTTLYAVANTNGLLIAGTGNKIEDEILGFCTKGGDQTVDISPIGNLLKSEVRELSKFLGVLPELYNAIPTDGLWNDPNKTDENQIGASYDEVEDVLKYCSNYLDNGLDGPVLGDSFTSKILQLNPSLTNRQKEVIDILMKRYKTNKHKMEMPPICIIPEKFKK